MKEEEDKSFSRLPASPQTSQSNGETASGAAEERGDGENGEERESGRAGGGVEVGTEGGDDGERGDEGGSEGGEGGKEDGDGGGPDATATDSDDDSASKEKASAPATDSNIGEPQTKILITNFPLLFYLDEHMV